MDLEGAGYLKIGQCDVDVMEVNKKQERDVDDAKGKPIKCGKN